MSYTNIGEYVARGDVERKVLDHIQTWFVTYLADVERKQVPPLAPRTLPQPKSYEVVNEFQRYPEDQMPTIAVISTGFAPGRKPRIDGDGMMTAWWAIAVGAVVSARDMRSAKDLSGFYGVALRLLMSQIPQLGGWASGVDLEDERYDDFPRVQERMIAACRLVYAVEVQDVMNVYQAPRTYDGQLVPPDDPYAVPTDYPSVTSLPININVTEE